MQTLFDTIDNAIFKPLAERMRPLELADYVGQVEIVGEASGIKKMIENDTIPSMIFWGPPGVGKTTLAKIIAHQTKASFHELSAVTSGVKEINEIFEIAKMNQMNGKKTILFVDEIHRFNKSQQDAFLPYVENGNIILIGATTENPSFEVNAALLSRMKVFVLKSLEKEDLLKILKRAHEKYYSNIKIEEACYSFIAEFAGGDARQALNTLENLLSIVDKNNVTKKDLEKMMHKKTFLYDKFGEEHYNLISALHKSMRNSDPDAALYYTARMLESGEDPLYLVRRLTRFASEDVGLANPNALVQAVSTLEAVKLIGMPECNVNIAQLVVYLSVSPKSNALYKAYEKVKKDALATTHLKVPLHLRNAETKLDKELGYGKGYRYAHDFCSGVTDMVCLPKELENRKYYEPTNHGNEKNIKEVMKKIEEIKKQEK